VAQRVGRGIALLFHDRGTLLPGKTRYPFYRRLGEPQGRYGRAENLVPTGIFFFNFFSLFNPLYIFIFISRYAKKKKLEKETIERVSL